MWWSVLKTSLTRKRLKTMGVSQHRWPWPPTRFTYTLREFPWGSKAFGSQDTSFWCWGLTQAASCMKSKTCSLRCLPLTVKWQRSPRGAKVPSQSAVRIRSRVHGNPRRPREEAGTSRYGTFGAPPFHDFVNYLIFGPMEEDVNDLNWFMLWCRRTHLLCTENFTEVKKVHPMWRYDLSKKPTFWQKRPVGWNQGFWKNMSKAFRMPTNNSWRCYTLLEALRGLGDVEKTMMNAFYQLLKIDTLRANG